MQSRNMEGAAPEAPSLERAVRLRDEAELPDRPTAAELLPVPPPPSWAASSCSGPTGVGPGTPSHKAAGPQGHLRVRAPSVSALLVGAGDRHPALSSAHTHRDTGRHLSLPWGLCSLGSGWPQKHAGLPGSRTPPGDGEKKQALQSSGGLENTPSVQQDVPQEAAAKEGGGGRERWRKICKVHQLL